MEKLLWFRENGQNQLSALRKGLNFESSEIQGDVVTDVYSYGNMYRIFLFFTSENKIYYSTIKNGKLKKPALLSGWAEGIRIMLNQSQRNRNNII